MAFIVSSLLVLSYENFREFLDKMCRCDGMVDVADSKSAGGDTVWVRVPPPAPKRKRRPMGVFFFLVPVGNAEPVQRVSLCPDETRKETLTVSFHTILPSGGDKNTP